jgi:NAD(P)-dependent dehydrogenase (short-subunit alcohol dehydrogenase family)
VQIQVGQLDGKIALVTGAGRGIGRSIALLFAREGAKVGVVSRTKATVDSVIREIRAAGGEAVGIECNVSERDQVLLAAKSVIDTFGAVDVLVNNAHDLKFQQCAFEKTTQEQFIYQLSCGLFATVHFMQACLPSLKERKGKVINFGSGAGVIGAIKFTPYAASKEAIRAVSRVAAKEWGPYGINVNVICPTSMTDALSKSIEDPQILAAISNAPLGIPGSPDDQVAPVALFLATSASTYITGHTFMVDGGNLIDAGR